MAKQERFSYSKIDVFSQCGFRYKLRYVDEHFINTDSIATVVGTAIHETEETIANLIKAGAPIDYIPLKNKLILSMAEFEYQYNKDWHTVDKSNRTYKEKLYDYLRRGIYRLEKFMLANGHIQIIDTEKEFEFTLPGTDFVFHGFIDRVLYNTLTGHYIVQDIKTYAVKVENKNLEVPLQFVVYAHAMKVLYGVDFSQLDFSYDLPFCDLIQKAGKENFLDIGTEKLKAMLASIQENNFVPNPTPLCHWCEYCPTNPNQKAEAKNLCPYHSLWTKELKTNAVASRWAGMEFHNQVLFEYIKCQNSSQ